MKLSFDSQHNPRPLTLVLAKKDGTKICALPAHHLKVAGEFNSAWSLEFSVYKTEDGLQSDIWDELVDFRLLWVKEFDLWFEIYVQIGDGSVCVKHISAKSLAEAELSQTMIFGTEINTESDILREDYKPTVFYDSIDGSCSLLNRTLAKTPHYRIGTVPVSLRNIQRTFSFDGISVYEALQEISEEIGCYFDFAVHSDENGKPDRRIVTYDLQSYCLECRSRGEFKTSCDKCGSANIVKAYGNDSGILVSTKNLTDEISFETNEDSVKNCFKLESGDELMDATIINCNPNGSGYLWYIPEFMKKDMPDELVNKIDSYDNLFQYYQEDHIVSLDSYSVSRYNNLISKYLIYDIDLSEISSSIVGYPKLMNEYYNTIDFKLLLQNGLMPSAETIETTAAEQAARLTYSRLSPVAVYSISSASSSTVNSAVLAMAKAQVDYRYQVKIISSSYSSQTWTGSFSVTNYHDEEDHANTSVISIQIIDNYEAYVSQMLDKSLSNTTDYATDIVTMFQLSDAEFAAELKKYSLSRLMAFDSSCEACLNVLIEQGAGNNASWNESYNLYNNLYTPYRNKQQYIKAEIITRESEIAIIDDIQSQILNNRRQIQNALNFENYLGSDLWLIFISFRREDIYSNSNYISDGLDNAELFSRALQFIEVAKNDLYKSANLQHTLSATLKNLLAMREFDGLTDDFELGNFIHVECDDEIYDVRLLSFEIDYDSLNDLSVTFSDVHEIDNAITDIKNVLDNSKAMSSSYDNVAHQAAQGNNSRKQLDDWTTNGLALTSLKIINSADNQDYVFDEHGMLFRKYQPLTGTYSDEQLKIINSTMAITDDNWTTVKTAIGAMYYIDPATNELTHAYGVNAEVLIGKLILGEKLGIYNSGATLRFDKDGLYVSNGNNTFTLNPNTTESLLSITNGVNELLKVSATGLYLKGEIVATSGYIGGETGWTIGSSAIYNGKTYLNDYSQGVYIGTDGIHLGNGATAFKVDNYGYMTTNSGSIAGINISNGTIYSGNHNSLDDTVNPGFYLDSSGGFSVGGAGGNSYLIFNPTYSTLTFKGVINDPTGGSIDGNKVTISNLDAGNITTGSLHVGRLSLGDNSGVTFGTDTVTTGETSFRIDSIYGDYFHFGPRIIVFSLTHSDGYQNDWIQMNGDNTFQTMAIRARAGWFQGSWTSTSEIAVSSDRNKKNSIEALDERYEEFFDLLSAKRFKYNDGTSDRFHTGFIAQEVESALATAGIGTEEFSGFVRQEGDGTEELFLRYENFISLNTWQIQKLKQKISELEAKIEAMNL